MVTKTAADLSITTDEHPHAARLREAFTAFGNRDVDTVLDRLTADCTWINAGNSPIAGTHQGREPISAMFAMLLEITGGTFAMTVLSVLADDTQAVAIYDATSTIGGQTQTHRFVLVEAMTPEGKAATTRILAFDQLAVDAHFNR